MCSSWPIFLYPIRCNTKFTSRQLSRRVHIHSIGKNLVRRCENFEIENKTKKNHFFDRHNFTRSEHTGITLRTQQCPLKRSRTFRTTSQTQETACARARNALITLVTAHPLAEHQIYDFFPQLTYNTFPPHPIRALDGLMTELYFSIDRNEVWTS